MRTTPRARGRHRRHHDREPAAAPARLPRLAHHRGRPETTSTTTSPATSSSRSATTRATRSSARGTASCTTASSSCSPRSTASTRRRGTVTLADGRSSPTTTWSSPPARRRGPTRRRACSARSGAGASSTSTPSRAPRRCATALASFDHGRLVVHITEMPIKCPVAPLEFTFLAEAWLARARPARPGRAGLRHAARARSPSRSPRTRLGAMLDERKIHVEPDFMVERIDDDRADAGLLRRARGALRPAGHRPAEHGRRLRRPLRARRRAELRAGRQAHAALHGVRHDLRPRRRLDIPTSKAGSVAHFAVDVFVDNFLEHVAGQPMTGSFDGHANCFVESGDGKALLIDFNYDTEPLPGKYPVPLRRPDEPAQGDPGQPPGQARVPLDLLERAAARPSRSRCPPTCRWPASTTDPRTPEEA